jgi:hypothetical protein
MKLQIIRSPSGVKFPRNSTLVLLDKSDRRNLNTFFSSAENNGQGRLMGAKKCLDQERQTRAQKQTGGA